MQSHNSNQVGQGFLPLSRLLFLQFTNYRAHSFLKIKEKRDVEPEGYSRDLLIIQMSDGLFQPPSSPWERDFLRHLIHWTVKTPTVNYKDSPNLRHLTVSDSWNAHEAFFLTPQLSHTVPTSGYRNPAPTLARMSRIGRTKPVGAPFCSGSWDKDKWVLAMQIGRFPNPWEKRKERNDTSGKNCNFSSTKM